MRNTPDQGQQPEEEPIIRWPDLEEAYIRAYQKGEQSSEFLDIEGNTERLRVYLRYKPYDLLIGRPLFPEEVPGINFWIQVTAPEHRQDIPEQLFVALEEDQRLFFLRNDILENAGWRKTEEVLKMIRQGHLLPRSEFTDPVD